jgi:hypothetical protein
MGTMEIRDMIEETRAAFDAEPCTATARRHAEALFDAWSDGDIGRDTLRDGMIAIAQGLTEGLSDLGHPVKVAVK